MPTKTLSCFFMTPFGKKPHQMAGGSYSDFDHVYQELSRTLSAIRSPRLSIARADQIRDKARLSHTVIQAIHDADVVIADLSAHNPNVFYELGIRHTLGKITIHIRQNGTLPAIDVVDLRAIEYDLTRLSQFQEEMTAEIRGRIAIAEAGRSSAALAQLSPVYGVLPSLRAVTTAEIEALEARIDALQEALAMARREQTAEALWDEGMAALRSGRVGRALVLLRRAYDAAPESMALRYGRVLSQQEQHEDALRILAAAEKRAVASMAPLAPVRKQLGLALKRAGQLVRAHEVLSEAVREDWSDDDLHGILGGLSKERGELEAALRSYEAGFEANDASTYCLLNMLCLRLLRDALGDRDFVARWLPRADELTAEALARPDADHWTRFDRAHALLYLGREDEALSVLSEALARTVSVGELRSARNNLDLLRNHGRQLPGLDLFLDRFDAAQEVLRESAA